MRFTAGDLRGAIADPQLTINRLRLAHTSGAAENTPRSPQRSWIEASLRRYYAARRSPDALIGDYQARTAGKGTSVGKRSEIANGEAMLIAFLALEEPEPTPRIAMQPRSDQLVVGHIISMGHDLIYELADGYLIREIWTDGVVRQVSDRQLMRAASLLHAEQLFGEARVQIVETWHLRLGVNDQMTRTEAISLAPRLKRLLDRIAAAVPT